MRKPTRPSLYHETPLDLILGTPAAVRILRVFSNETTPLTVPDLASLAGLSRAGAHRALSRLVQTGLVRDVGSGHAMIYRINEIHYFADMVEQIFRREQTFSAGLYHVARDLVTRTKENIVAIWLIESEQPRDSEPALRQRRGHRPVSKHIRGPRPFSDYLQGLDPVDEDDGIHRGLIIVVEGEDTDGVRRALKEEILLQSTYEPYNEVEVMTQTELRRFTAAYRDRWQVIMDNAFVLYGLFPRDYDELGE